MIIVKDLCVANSFIQVGVNMKIADITRELSARDVIEFKELFNSPIQLSQAKQVLSPFIVDQDLFSIIDNELNVVGDKDGRDLIVSWLKQNMPELFEEPFEPAPAYESPISSHPDITGE